MRLDTNRDGEISKDEFTHGFVRLPQLIGAFGVTEGEANYAASGGVVEMDVRFADGEQVPLSGLDPEQDIHQIKDIISRAYPIPVPFQHLVDFGRLGVEVPSSDFVLSHSGRTLQLQVRDQIPFEFHQLPQHGASVTVDGVLSTFSYISWLEEDESDGSLGTVQRVSLKFHGAGHPVLGAEYGGIWGADCRCKRPGVLQIDVAPLGTGGNSGKDSEHVNQVEANVTHILEGRASLDLEVSYILDQKAEWMQLQYEIQALQTAAGEHRHKYESARNTIQAQIEDWELRAAGLEAKRDSLWHIMAEWQQVELDEFIEIHVSNTNKLKQRKYHLETSMLNAEHQLRSKQDELAPVDDVLRNKYGM